MRDNNLKSTGLTQQDELDAHHRVQNLLRKLKSSKVTLNQSNAIQELLFKLKNYQLPEEEKVENEEVVFSEEDLSFLDRMEKDKSTFQFLDLIKEEMYLIIKNPLIGTRYVGSNYGLAFRKELPENAGNALILKRKVRRKYRLIYAYGGNLSRPYFIEFDHRKDVYKHRQVGTSS